MDVLLSRLGNFVTPESRSHGLEFQPRPNDVFITTFPKCGTTWVSFIAHSLRTRGHIDFDEITAVVPWTIKAIDCGMNLNDEQVASPRLFKSHENFDDVPKGGKYIYVVRNPLDVAMSYYSFLCSFAQVDSSTIPLDDFINHMLFVRARLWDHYLSFYKQKDNENVLWLFYEDLLQDRMKIIEIIADFMDISLDEELRYIVAEQSSFYIPMKDIYDKLQDHEELFDDHLVFNSCKERMGFSRDTQVATSKVNKGKSGAGARLSEDMKKKLNDEWIKVCGSATGINSYEELRKQLSPLKHE